MVLDLLNFEFAIVRTFGYSCEEYPVKRGDFLSRSTFMGIEIYEPVRS